MGKELIMETSNLEEIKRSLELLKMMEPEERRILTPSIELREEEWSDKIFKEEYIDKFPVFKRPSLTEFANAAKAFLNIYMTGEIQSDDYEQVLLTLFGGMKIETDYLGAEKFHSSVGDESPKSLSVSEASIIEDLQPQFLPSVGQAATAQNGRTGVSVSVPIITVDDAKKWYKTLMVWLSEQIPDSSESEDNSENRQKIKRIELSANYVGLLALKTMRMIVKNQVQTVAHILNRQNYHFKGLWREPLIYETPPPPHLHFLDHVHPFIKRFSGSSIRLLTYLIGSYLSDTESVRRRILYACIMLPLLQVTFRGINWLYEAARCLGWKVHNVLKCFRDEMGSAVQYEVENVENFVLSLDRKEESWHWARLFRHRALLQISCRRLPIISVVCAAIVYDHDPAHFIWRTAQFKEIKKNDELFKFGLRTSMIIKKRRRQERMMELIPLTPETEQILLMINDCVPEEVTLMLSSCSN